MATFYQANVTATNGSAFVTVNSSADDIGILRERAFLQVAGEPRVVEVKRGIPGDPDQIELAEPWGFDTVTGDALGVPTAGDLADAVAAIRNLNQQASEILENSLSREGDAFTDEIPVFGSDDTKLKSSDRKLSDFPRSLPDITSLSSLNTAALVDGQQFKRKEFWPSTGVGGVDLYWDASRPVSEHNGGTIIDPVKISELDTVNKTFGTYFTPDTVSGNTGCFVVEYGYEVDVTAYGAVGISTFDSLEPFSAAGLSIPEVVIPAGDWNLSDIPSYSGITTWVVRRGASFTTNSALPYSNDSKIVSFGNFDSLESESSYHEGIFQYLEHNSALTGYGNLGLHGSARTSWRTVTGGGGADIGLSGFASNNLPGHLGGAWAIYGTAVRESGCHNTHACELDIANMGNTVQLTPANMFATGQTHCLWLGSGGEITETADQPGTASVAIGILSNDPNLIANYDKGILFHNRAIAGTDGATGAGTAMALATGHQINWLNNSNGLAGSIGVSNRSGANGQRLDFSAFGVIIQDVADGGEQFQVENTESAENHLAVTAAVAGAAPQISARGSDTNVDLKLLGKGAGKLMFGIHTSTSDTPVTGYIEMKDSSGTVRRLAVV